MLARSTSCLLKNCARSLASGHMTSTWWEGAGGVEISDNGRRELGAATDIRGAQLPQVSAGGGIVE